jgi:plastocyanin domain-containing protein
MKSIVAALLLTSLVVVNPVTSSAARVKAKEQRIEVSVTSKGFEPASIPVKAGAPIVLVVTRKTDRTCATALVMASRKIRKDLPLNKAVEIRLAAEKPGTLRFACPMDMIAGEIVVN